MRNAPQRMRSVAGAAVLAVAVLGLSGCEEDADDASAVTVETIQADVEAYEGQEVTVLAEVQRIVSPFSFSVRGTTDALTEPILVVSADEWSDLEPDVPVRVEGELQTGLVLVELEELLDTDLDDALYAAWEGGTYIVAEHSERVD